MLSCFDTETGDLLWRVDTVTDYDSTVPVQGTSQAPIVEGDLLIAAVGGEPDAKIVAFDKVTGDEVWRSLDNISETGYSAPIVIDAGGVDNYFWHATAITSLNPETGEIYWNQDFTIGGGMAITKPRAQRRYFGVSPFFNGSKMLA
ncbi:MAG: hypothetical protein Ct9H300mP25_15350 [Acidobacteriota bacterium]|nr:MAG: hypothetical protein Ct9H300mP25_15350 [Acidobacteriota bacterium]